MRLQELFLLKREMGMGSLSTASCRTLGGLYSEEIPNTVLGPEWAGLVEWSGAACLLQIPRREQAYAFY
ncbi:MAG: hypothetical protein QXH08_04960 [Candidatus Hadarchaeales archaeon]